MVITRKIKIKTNNSGVIHKGDPKSGTIKILGIFPIGSYSRTENARSLCNKTAKNMFIDGDLVIMDNSKVNCEKCLKKLGKL